MHGGLIGIPEGKPSPVPGPGLRARGQAGLPRGCGLADATPPHTPTYAAPSTDLDGELTANLESIKS